jgi:phospholipid/cholesterol/gamma-HCH transport system substrate-binding protein
MESRVNYTIVGLFVILLTSALLFFIYWLTKQFGEQAYDSYYVHLTESVAGLNTDAAVKYRGVDVGTVVHIGLNPANPEEVELLLMIEQQTPVKTDTTAAINFYGITGLAYIELKGLDKDAPLLKEVHAGDDIPVIPSRPSTFTRIDQSLSLLAEKISYTLDGINRVLGDENQQNLASLLAETSGLASDLRSQVAGVGKLIEDGRVMENEVIDAFASVNAASISVSQMANRLEAISTEFGAEMNSGMRSSFSALRRLLADMDRLTGRLQHTIEKLDASPADLLFKRSQPRPGPGEEGFDG